MPSPPKPWERGGTAAAAAAAPVPTSTTTPMASSTPTTAASTTAGASSSTLPSVPTRPPVLSNASTLASSTTGYSPYSSASPYNRFGSTLGSSYSPYGMNSMYGGYGSYGGMGGMYGGMPGYGMAGGPGFDPTQPTLTQTLESTTQHTFTLLHSIVQTFAGVAQMLESTFVATHSSFFAMVGVVDQLGQLRAALGSVLGLFGLVRWLRDLVAGRRGEAGALRGEFRDFVNGRPVQPQGQPAPAGSKKPLIIFLLAIFGVPYAMHRLVRVLIERQKALAEQQGGALPPLDPSQLTFARALYPFDASSPAELSLKESEIVAIMGKLDPVSGAEVDPRIEVEASEWWKGRTRDGREGWFPKKWVQVLERRKPLEAPAETKKVD